MARMFSLLGVMAAAVGVATASPVGCPVCSIAPVPGCVINICDFDEDDDCRQRPYEYRADGQMCDFGDATTTCVAAVAGQPETTCTKTCPDGTLTTQSCMDASECDGDQVCNLNVNGIGGFCCNAEKPVCAANEEFKECGTNCPAICGEEPESCIQLCVIECQCQEGFVRLSKARDAPCVPVNDARCTPTTEPPVVCAANEEFKECGSSCPAICGEEPESCIQLCVSECQCQDGFVRLSKARDAPCVPMDERCTPTTEPPVVCAANEEFKECGTNCPAICGEEPKPCNKACNLNVCQCQEGFVRLSKARDAPCVPDDARCTPTTEPPVVCAANEEFKECGTDCPATCGDLDNQICNKRCRENVCQCKTGFALSSEEADAVCVPVTTNAVTGQQMCETSSVFRYSRGECDRKMLFVEGECCRNRGIVYPGYEYQCCSGQSKDHKWFKVLRKCIPLQRKK